MHVTPPLFLQILADRNLKPGAINIRLGKGDMEALLPLIVDKDFSELTAAFPCFVCTDLEKSLTPEWLETLQGAGCRIATGALPHHSDEQTRPTFPPTAQWLAGDWYLASPAKMSANQAASRTLSLKLLKLVASEADTCEIEGIFRQDPVLAYHLLRLVNSLGVSVGRRISSFSQAILILGRQQLKRWLNLMLFAASRDDYRSAMLLAQVSVRARSMELLAKAGGLERSVQEQAFMAGMFSLLGTLFGLPLDEILTPLKLNDILTSAVLRHEGTLGTLLHIVEQAEHADGAGLTDLLKTADLTADDFNRLNLEAHQWMFGIIREQQGSRDA